MRYSYDRTAAKKSVKEKAPTVIKRRAEPGKDAETSRTDGAKREEVEKAIEAIRVAIDLVLDCAPNSRDYQDVEDGYDSKAYTKAVAKHNDRVDTLHDILSGLNDLLSEAKG